MDEASRKKLLDDYAKNRGADVREKLIIEYAPLVKVVAGRLSMYLGYNVEFEDLCSYGIFGLIDAICIAMFFSASFTAEASAFVSASTTTLIRPPPCT
jgi:RNA polymerase sigma factor for flagellar operon FliA